MRIVSREDILIHVNLPYARLDKLMKESVRVTCHAMQSDEDAVRFCNFVNLFEPRDAVIMLVSLPEKDVR